MVQALLKAWNFYIGKPILVVVTCYLLLVVLGLIDFNTGNQLSFSFLYLLPVLLITWVGGGISGAVASFVSVVIWQLASYLSGETYPTVWIPIWNSVSRLIFIFVGVLLLDKFHQNLQLERNFARTDFLTGTANRRAFFEIAGIEINRAVRYGHHISVIYIDLDELKIGQRQLWPPRRGCPPPPGRAHHLPQPADIRPCRQGGRRRILRAASGSRGKSRKKSCQPYF